MISGKGRVFKHKKGGWFWTFYIIQKITHEMEIIWWGGGGSREPPP